jgi:hypothetical protein
MKKIVSKIGVAAVGLMASAVSFAAVSDPFTSTVTDVSSKVSTYGAALVGVAAVGVGFAVGIKYVKKIVRAS